MSKITGQHCAAYFAGYELTGRTREWGFEATWDEVDATALQDGGRNSMPGLPTTSATLETFLDAAALSTHEALKDPKSRSGQVLMLPIGQGAAPVIGDPCLAMTVEQFKYRPGLQVAAAVTAGADFKGKVKPGMGIVLADTTITVTTAFAGVDEGASSALGGDAYLEILTPVVADTYVVKAQHSILGSIWVDLATFAANGSARTSERQAIAGTIYQHVRALATRTGTAGNSLRLAVAVARHAA